MRKMKKHRFFGLTCILFLYIINKAKAEGIFEDADKLTDLTNSNSGQHFDLRHTIPGIPEVDYPIYSHVPKTTFECTERHEGYYADIESRCQAFRICTHTARSVHGFGFLCPNGTLFSQKYFVCDWYRNVNCDDSERFFSKNDINRVGSSFDMMETVRQMMEYPMKTISKALQQNPGSSRKPTQRHRGSNRGAQGSNDTSKETETVRARGRPGSTRKSVTRDQVESAHNRGNTKYGREKNTSTTTESEETAENKENVTSVTKSDENNIKVESGSVDSDVTDDVYVNSLGELSTDPGVTFDRTNAHIIAEPRPYRYDKKLNFAEKVNAGLNDFIDSNESLAPDYIKSLRDTSNETAKIDLPSNINGLLDEIANDLNPSTSGYQVKKPVKAKHAFRFLSRGFSSQEDPYKYTKPKQTASTIRFTPNQLPIEEEKTPTKHVLEIAPDAVPFGYSTIAPETSTPAPPLLGDATDYLLPPPELPTFDEVPYLSPPALEPTDTAGVTSVPTEEAIDTSTIPNTVETEQEINTVTPDSPTYAALIDTTTPLPTTESSNIATPTVVPDIAQNLIASSQQDQTQKFNTDETPIDEDRVDANKQAANLFISGLQLTNNENDTEVTTLGNATAHTPLLIQVAEDHSYLTAWITSTSLPVTDAVPTTTPETQPEQGSLQERIRNYRRLANLQRATAKPLIYGKRAGLRMTKIATTTTSTTPKTTSTTRSYLKRIAASRLRLSRLAAAAGNKQNQASLTTVPVLPPVDNAVDSGSNRKLSVRNIDKETGNASNNIGDSTAAKNAGVVTWESVKNSLQRFQVNRKFGRDTNGNGETTSGPKVSPTAATSSTTTRNSLTRKRNRVSNFKSQSTKSSEIGSNDYETINEPATSTSSSAVSTSTSMSVSSSLSFSKPSSLSFLNTIPLIALTASPPPQQQTLSLNSNQAQNDLTTSTIPSNSFTNRDTADNTNLNSNSASGSTNFISFDKLTRSIVDDSILQNYRAGQILGRSSLGSPVNSYKSSTSSTSQNTFGQVSTSSVRSSFAQNTPVTYNKLPAKAPSQLTPPQRPAHLPSFPTINVLTTPGPRIVVARAEGQRIEPNDVSSLISSLIAQQQKAQPKTTPATSYVPLNDFLSKKFGNQVANKAALSPTPNYNTQTRQYQQLQQYNQPQSQINQHQQQQQQQQYKQTETQQHFSQNQPQQQPQTIRHQQQQQQQQFLHTRPISTQQYQQKPQQLFQSQQQPQYQANQQQQFPALVQQQKQNNYYQSIGSIPLQQSSPQTNYFQQNQPQNLFNQQSTLQFPPPVAPTLQSLSTQNIIDTFKQQQQQLPPFPPLATQATQPQQSTQLLQQFDGNNNYLNVQLPALTNGLIPAPTNQIAQKRSDIGIDGLELTDFTPAHSVFTGATSYDVPLSSIGRLPNDMQALFRRVRKY